MKVINDTPKGTSNVEEYTDVISYMENKYPNFKERRKRKPKPQPYYETDRPNR